MVVPDAGLSPDRSPRVVAAGVAAVATLAFAVLAVIVHHTLVVSPAVDLRIITWISARRGSGLTVVAKILTTLGSAPVIIGFALLSSVWLWLGRRNRRLALTFAATEAFTAGLVTLIKIVVARPRPDPANLTGAPALDYAFPSGHTTNSAVVYVLFAIVA